MTRNLGFAAALLLAVTVGVLGFVAIAFANPSSFATGVTTNNAASTSPAYMTPGTGTSTTPVYDAYAQTNAGATYKADIAGLLVQFTASSTNSVLNISVEYSQDGVDYYRNFVVDPNQIGTSTTPFSLTTAFTTTWKYASSTVVGGVGVIGDRATAAIMIPTPFRYTRVVFSVTGANGAVWAQLVPVKEQK